MTGMGRLSLADSPNSPFGAVGSDERNDAIARRGNGGRAIQRLFATSKQAGFLTAGSVEENLTCLSHPSWPQCRHMSTEPRLIHRMEIVHTIGRDTISLSRQSELRNQTPVRPSQRRNHDRPDTIRQRVASQHQDRPIPSRCTRTDITPQHQPSPPNLRPDPRQRHLPGKPQNPTKAALTMPLLPLPQRDGSGVDGSPFEVDQTCPHQAESPMRQDLKSQHPRAEQKPSSYRHANPQCTRRSTPVESEISGGSTTFRGSN